MRGSPERRRRLLGVERIRPARDGTTVDHLRSGRRRRLRHRGHDDDRSRPVLVTRTRVAAVAVRCGAQVRCRGTLTLTARRTKLGSQGSPSPPARAQSIRVVLTPSGFRASRPRETAVGSRRRHGRRHSVAHDHARRAQRDRDLARRAPRSRRRARGSRRASGRRFARAGRRGRTASRPGRDAALARVARAPPRSAARRRRGSRRAAGRAGAPPPPSPQCARAIAAASSARLDARGDGRAAARRVEERQLVGAVAEHRHAERLEQLARRRHVEQRLDARARRPAPACAASSPRSAETSGCSVQPRWTPPRPPVAITRIPAARQTASVPPTVVAPTAPCTAAAARSRGPTLRARRVEPLELGSRQPDADARRRARRSSPAPRRPRARAARTRAPTATPSPGGKPCATSVVSSATTARLARRRDLRRDRRSRCSSMSTNSTRPSARRCGRAARLAEAGALVDLDRALVERGDVETDERSAR